MYKSVEHCVSEMPDNTRISTSCTSVHAYSGKGAQAQGHTYDFAMTRCLQRRTVDFSVDGQSRARLVAEVWLADHAVC